MLEICILPAIILSCLIDLSYCISETIADFIFLILEGKQND